MPLSPWRWKGAFILRETGIGSVRVPLCGTQTISAGSCILPQDPLVILQHGKTGPLKVRGGEENNKGKAHSHAFSLKKLRKQKSLRARDCIPFITRATVRTLSTMKIFLFIYTREQNSFLVCESSGLRYTQQERHYSMQRKCWQPKCSEQQSLSQLQYFTFTW